MHCKAVGSGGDQPGGHSQPLSTEERLRLECRDKGPGLRAAARQDPSRARRRSTVAMFSGEPDQPRTILTRNTSNVIFILPPARALCARAERCCVQRWGAKTVSGGPGPRPRGPGSGRESRPQKEKITTRFKVQGHQNTGEGNPRHPLSPRRLCRSCVLCHPLIPYISY